MLHRSTPARYLGTERGLACGWTVDLREDLCDDNRRPRLGDSGAAAEPQAQLTDRVAVLLGFPFNWAHGGAGSIQNVPENIHPSRSTAAPVGLIDPTTRTSHIDRLKRNLWLFWRVTIEEL